MGPKWWGAAAAVLCVWGTPFPAKSTLVEQSLGVAAPAGAGDPFVMAVAVDTSTVLVVADRTLGDEAVQPELYRVTAGTALAT